MPRWMALVISAGLGGVMGAGLGPVVASGEILMLRCWSRRIGCRRDGACRRWQHATSDRDEQATQMTSCIDDDAWRMSVAEHAIAKPQAAIAA